MHILQYFQLRLGLSGWNPIVTQGASVYMFTSSAVGEEACSMAIAENYKGSKPGSLNPQLALLWDIKWVNLIVP